MKKFFTKLIAFILLLATGVSNAWAYDYPVIYDNTIPGAGYTVRNTSVVSTPADATTLTSTTQLSDSNIGTYIAARAVNGYTNEMWVTNNQIYIKYKYNGTAGIITWHDDVFEYSTLYTRSSTSEKLMPTGEVAIRLYLPGEEEFTDTIYYYDSTNDTGINGSPYGRFGSKDNAAGKINYAADDDGDDLFGTYNTSTAKYVNLGKLDGGYSSNTSIGGMMVRNTWYYKRTHMVRTANGTGQRNITIPREVTAPAEKGGGTYKVTAIQKWGFTYAKSSITKLYYCKSYNTTNDVFSEETTSSEYSFNRNINDHSNDYLQSVDFGTNSNINSIGDYAFMSCNYIKEVIIPWKVEYLGVGAFECCQSLEHAEFQVCPTYDNPEFGTTRVRTIEDWAFYTCKNLKTLYLADGITRINGLNIGASLQYLISLTYIRLPNTLTYIGPHFLCCALQLESLTIPASVTYMDGAAFHGCESLRKVNMLGKPADLKDAHGGATFGQNEVLCGNHVNSCHFIVPASELNNYKTHSVWKLINENGDYTGTKNGNYLEQSTGETEEFKQDFTAGKWGTIIFPHRYMIDGVRVDEGVGVPADVLNSEFGSYADGTYVAELSTVTRDRSDEYLYHLTFTQITTDYIPSGKPLMIKPAKQVTGYVMYDKNDMDMQSGFTLEMTNEHGWHVQANNGAVVTMKGKYVDEPLKRYDFIFTASEPASDGTYTYKFRKLMDGKATAKAFKCWWSITLDGIFANVNAAGVAKERLFDGLDEVETDKPLRFVVDAIYDLNGRKLDVPKEELPSGMFIVNGKKVVVK